MFVAAIDRPVHPWNPCTWPNPKPYYEGFDSIQLLNIQKLNRHATVELKSKVFSSNDIYYFVPTSGAILVCGDGRDCFRVTVPDFSWRPLSYRWVNEKLLYVDITFNPHAGAYWLVDVEEQSIVFSEHWLESLDEWLKCRER